MQRKIIFGLIWIGFLGYAFFVAPAASPDTLDLIIDLSKGNWQDYHLQLNCLLTLVRRTATRQTIGTCLFMHTTLLGYRVQTTSGLQT